MEGSGHVLRITAAAESTLAEAEQGGWLFIGRQGGQGLLDAVEDYVGSAHSVDLVQLVALPVIVEEGRGLIHIVLKALANDLRVVISPASSRQTLDNLVVIYLELEDTGEGRGAGLEEFIERGYLADGARKAV